MDWWLWSQAWARKPGSRSAPTLPTCCQGVQVRRNFALCCSQVIVILCWEMGFDPKQWTKIVCWQKPDSTILQHLFQPCLSTGVRFEGKLRSNSGSCCSATFMRSVNATRYEVSYWRRWWNQALQGERQRVMSSAGSTVSFQNKEISSCDPFDSIN